MGEKLAKPVHRIHFVTFFGRISLYQDRYAQIISAIPHSVVPHILTLEREIVGEPTVSMASRFRLLNRNIFLSLRLCFFVLRLLLKGQSVVVYDWWYNFWPLALLRLPRLHYVYSPVMSSFGWTYKRWIGDVPGMGVRYDWLRAKRAVQDLFVARLCRTLVLQSQDLKAYYERIYGVSPGKVLVVSNAVPGPIKQVHRQAFSPSERRRLTFGYLGNLERHKGIDDMLQFMKVLQSQEPDCRHRLIAVGKSYDRGARPILQAMEQNPSIELRSPISKGETYEFFDEIDIMVLFSYHEGSPRILSEFLHTGKPALFYALPGTTYLSALPGMHIFDCGDYRSAAQWVTSEKIQKLNPRDPREVEQLVLRGKSMSSAIETIVHELRGLDAVAMVNH